MFFLTVGTQFHFDRLVKGLDRLFDEGLIHEEVFAQIGESSYRPRNFEFTSFLEKRLFESWIKKASGVIGHGGIGTITMALDNEKPLLVMPRLKRYGEVVNNHQVAIVKKFEELGHLLAAYEVEELSAQINKLKSFVPRKRTKHNEAVVRQISSFLYQVSELGQ